MSNNLLLETFYEEFGTAVNDRTAAFFVGAGLSVPAGYKDWGDLVEVLAEEIGLNAAYEHDFVTLAQFYYNQTGRDRTQLTQKLQEIYSVQKPYSENHRLIASLPVETIWTTNYDPLIEEAFADAKKVLAVKKTVADLSKHERGRSATLYKMHGDYTLLEEAVLIKDDYETYSLDREEFVNALKGDFISKTFLFLGFSFTDPNIRYVLSRVRLSMPRQPHPHYCIMKWPDRTGYTPEAEAQYQHDKRRQVLLNEDLRHNNIHVIMIDKWDEITDILRELNKRAHQRNIFVSGSAKEYGELGRERAMHLAARIGERIIAEGCNLVSGFGSALAETVLNSALKEYYCQPELALTDRIIMRPFPKYEAGTADVAAIYDRHRRDMLASVGYAIFLCGNKADEVTGKTVRADGVCKEFEIAKEFGICPIPVGVTGYAAKEIWEEVNASLGTFYPGQDVAEAFAVLGDTTKADHEIVDAIFTIISRTSKHEK